MQKRDIGDLAEQLALSWLEHHGYRKIETNYLRRSGEIDLIVQPPNRDSIVFVEVRYRRSWDFGGALVSVDRRKQLKLRRTVNAWLQHNACAETTARIDVIGVIPRSADTPLERLWRNHELQWVENAVEE